MTIESFVVTWMVGSETADNLAEVIFIIYEFQYDNDFYHI